MRTFVTLLSVILLLPGLTIAQQGIDFQPLPSNGTISWLARPYEAGTVPPIRLQNSPRLQSLIRAGNLYLTAQDVVALAIENNIDVEVQRYGPLLARQVLKRAQAGGALRNVGSPLTAGPQSVSLQGVSVNAAGGVGLTTGTAVSSGGGIVTQLGPALLPLDPTVQLFTNFQHSTTPQSNTVLTGTTALITSSRTYQAQYSQNWDFGLTAQLTYSTQHIGVNSDRFNVNPYTTGFMDLQITQNLLQGFGSAVNGRNIRVQKNNLKVSDLQFRQQVMITVAAALNLYWDLAAFEEDVRARKQALNTAQQLLEGNQKQVEAGSLAPIEVTRAEAQVYSTRQDLIVAQTNLLQQETVLKNALTRNGVAAAGLAGVHAIALDRIVVPPQEQIRPLDDLIQEALSKRVEVEEARINLQSNELNLVGIRNSLKPTLQVFAELTNNGLTGNLNPLVVQQLVELKELAQLDYLRRYLTGNLLGQIARRNYPNYSAGLSLNIPLRNRAAQADYATSLLEIRQNELNLRKNTNQIRVDVQNAVTGLQQARARYEAAAQARALQQQILSGDQRRYELGAATPFQVVQDQRDLASAQSTEIQSMANYTHARIALDQALGTTLEVNHISIAEALRGHLAQPSTLPPVLPREERQ
jgi:outer membrane protein TolC